MLGQPESVKRSALPKSSRATSNVSIANLITTKVRFLGPMVVIYMLSYVGVTALAGFAKGFMALKVAGSLNVGFVLIAFNYSLSWVLALVYVLVANRIFDPMVEQVVAATTEGKGARP